jgi:hypothetical protein
MSCKIEVQLGQSSADIVGHACRACASGMGEKADGIAPTSVLAEGTQDVGRGVSDVALSKGRNKVRSDCGTAVVAALHSPLLHELRCHSLVIAADERICVVDGGAVHRVPCHRPSTPAKVPGSEHIIAHYIQTSKSTACAARRPLCRPLYLFSCIHPLRKLDEQEMMFRRRRES